MGHTRSAIAMKCWLLCAALVFLRSVCQSQSAGQDGRIHLDVVVTDAGGKPVSGLRAEDFRVLDEGVERKVATFAAFDGVITKPDPPTQMIIVVDALNNGFVEMGYIRQGLKEYLRENEGRLAQPTMIARLVPSGIQFLSQPTQDGNALAGIADGIGASVRPMGLDDLNLSLNALTAVANKEVNEPGRKLLVWLGPGWPTPAPPQGAITSVDERNQRAYFEVARQIAKHLHDARMVLYGGYSGADFYMRDFLKPVRKASDVDPRILRLNVLAVKSGGKGELPEANRDSVVTEVLDHFAADANSFYELSFVPPKAQSADEFHELRVEVKRSGLTARTITGYYDQPEYFRTELKKEGAVNTQRPAVQGPEGPEVIQQQPALEERGALRLATVAQLAAIVETSKDKRDGDVAKEIEHLELRERLSSQKLVALSLELRGTKSRMALMAVGDASVFLEPPSAEVPTWAVPDLAEQRAIVSRAVDYLARTIPKLPNFYAKRFTTSLEEIWTPKDEEGAHHPGVLRPAGEFKATVYYRSGKEVVREEGVQEHGLVTRGTFGPILTTVIVDASRAGTTQWSRWEEGPNGPMTVFRFQIPQEKSRYEVSSWSSVPGGGAIDAMAPSAYHGEIGIDPGTGTILRLVLEADPALGSSVERADIMVEYGTVAIGGKAYTCPVRSVSYSVGALDLPTTLTSGTGWKREAARLNDVVFSDYHVFRAEMRIVP